ncbi:MAG: hypothetical protein Q8K63_12825, partial [Acidimicrobiales bacterium]|nr:hypothetical protein [Acidimicrobiales bacterium]
MEPVELRPLRVGETIDVAIKLYRAHFLTLVKIVLIVSAPAQILLGLMQASIRINLDSTDDFGNIDPVTGQPDIDTGTFAATIAGFLVIGLITMITSELASAATFRAVGAAYLGEEQDWKQSARYALKRVLSIIWLAVAKYVVIFAGLIACIIPGIYFYAAFGVTTPVLMLEGKRGFKAMGRSKQLVKGRWWPVAGVLLLGTVLTYIVSAVIGAVVGGVFVTNNEIAGDVANVVGGIVGSALTVPILAAIITVLY